MITNIERTTHFRWVLMPSGEETLMPMATIRLLGLGPRVLPRGGYTRYVRVIRDDDPTAPTYRYEGWAACSDEDNYVKAIGRNIARGRAYAWDRKDVLVDDVVKVVPMTVLMHANELEAATVVLKARMELEAQGPAPAIEEGYRDDLAF